MSEKTIGGHVTDAILHAKADKTSEEKLPEYIAQYLLDHCNPFISAHHLEMAYEKLREGVDRALDIRDPSGAKLRHYEFTARGFLKELQATLLDAMRDADHCFP